MAVQLMQGESRQIGRFLVIGGVCVLTYYVLFIGLTETFGVWYVHSAVIAFLVYFTVHFLFQKFWVFRNMDRKYVARQLFQYSIAACGNWILNTTLLYLLVEYAGLPYIPVQIVLTVLVSILAYFVFRWIFRNR